ncbi:hypothetical protein CRYUN_Cryun19dG0153600 [Craigia yunnanensis]
MLESGSHPNSVTVLGILSACSHVGLISKALELFKSMRDIYRIQPGLEHYVSIINLLGRAGRVEEAEEFVMSLPFEPDRAIWGAMGHYLVYVGSVRKLLNRAKARHKARC